MPVLNLEACQGLVTRVSQSKRKKIERVELVHDSIAVGLQPFHQSSTTLVNTQRFQPLSPPPFLPYPLVSCWCITALYKASHLRLFIKGLTQLVIDV